MRRLYYGFANVQIGSSLHNHFSHGLCESEEEMVGRMVAIVREKHPATPIANVVAYPIDDEHVRAAAALLESKP